jgi:hypothetical protein
MSLCHGQGIEQPSHGGQWGGDTRASVHLKDNLIMAPTVLAIYLPGTCSGYMFTIDKHQYCCLLKQAAVSKATAGADVQLQSLVSLVACRQANCESLRKPAAGTWVHMSSTFTVLLCHIQERNCLDTLPATSLLQLHCQHRSCCGTGLRQPGAASPTVEEQQIKRQSVCLVSLTLDTLTSEQSNGACLHLIRCCHIMT